MRGSLRAAQTPDPLAAEIARGQPSRRWPLRSLAFLGPSFVACVAYIDPGNFATNIAGGSRYGYTLLWVVVASNLMAMLIQWLSAKLGIASGRNLAELCRERFPRRVSIGLWLQAEFIAMATDLAEFLGAALGIQLLLGIPLFPAAVITGVITLLILGLQRYGFRPLEAVITAFVFVIGICYLGELYFAHPPLGTVAKHAVLPEFAGNESVLLAVGIIGATVMPHVIYLHSALTQQRIVPQNDEEAKSLYRYTRIDVLIAMVIAGLINISMLVVAATVFYGSGLLNIDSLEGAHRTLEPILGGASSVLFALAL
ncbi:MAG: Nramp family divalent metal transporter, partial [Gaiellaceae bacterium]